jgi:hypothetical protein
MAFPHRQKCLRSAAQDLLDELRGGGMWRVSPAT